MIVESIDISKIKSNFIGDRTENIQPDFGVDNQDRTLWKQNEVGDSS